MFEVIGAELPVTAGFNPESRTGHRTLKRGVENIITRYDSRGNKEEILASCENNMK